MNLGVEVSRLRCAAVWGVVTGAAVGLAGLLQPVLAEGLTAARRGGSGAAGFDSVLVWGCAGAGMAVTVWLWVVATIVTVDAVRGVRTVRRGVPAGVRSVLLGLCGAALTTGLAAPAQASGEGPVEPHVLTGLRLPERVAVSPATFTEPAPRADQEPVAAVQHRAETVVVARGDTLWAIAAEHLGHDAADDEVAAAWPAVYELNRDLIGPDPGLIEPGQRLALPPLAHDGSAR